MLSSSEDRSLQKAYNAARDVLDSGSVPSVVEKVRAIAPLRIK